MKRSITTRKVIDLGSATREIKGNQDGTSDGAGRQSLGGLSRD